MSIYCSATYTAGLGSSTVFVTAQQVSDDYYWNPGAVAWQNAPSVANKRNNMAEGASENAGTYTVTIANMGSPGWIRLRFHDDSLTGDVPFAIKNIYVFMGVEVHPAIALFLDAGVITATSIADGALTAAKFASGAFDAVWSVAARLLTAGTNIVLAKGVGVTGFTDIDAAGVRSAVGLASNNLDTQLGAINTAVVTTIPTTLASMSGATFDTATDSLEALRNRGDAAWTTATGFSTHTAADVVAALNAATYDGVTFGDLQVVMLAWAAGKIHETSAGVFVYHDQNDDPLFTRTKAGDLVTTVWA